MPIFEYHCNNCTTEFEVLHRASDADELVKCPCCGEPDAKKRFSAFATSGTQKENAMEGAT